MRPGAERDATRDKLRREVERLQFLSDFAPVGPRDEILRRIARLRARAEGVPTLADRRREP
ncbi:MAG TPA: hypothetical protein VFI25_02300 [Planctomycetota bacterium]|nr:hypothetical protein [Planctomycetota bacterium]